MFKQLLTGILLLSFGSTLSAADLVREFSGSKTMTTASFDVDGPWLLDWRLDGDYEALLALDITLVDSTSGRHVGRVLHTKKRGRGLKLFETPGTYHFRVSTTLGRWRLKIKSIDEEEVELYTPRGGAPRSGIIQ